MNIEDRNIIELIKKRDIDSFEKLFKAFNRPLTLFAQQYVFDVHVGEDIVQENFVYFWENIHKIEIRTSLKAYFYQSIKNRCYNYLRNQNIYDKHKIRYVESLLASNDPDVFTDPEIHNVLNNAISLLPPEMGKIIRLKYIEKKKILEVSGILQVSNNTVKTQLARGKQKLKELLSEMINLNIFMNL